MQDAQVKKSLRKFNINYAFCNLTEKIHCKEPTCLTLYRPMQFSVVVDVSNEDGSSKIMKSHRL